MRGQTATAPSENNEWPGAALVSLAILGSIAAKAGNAPVVPSVARVVFWSAVAMAVTAGVGMLFGTGGA
jgi:VIT1/CCC1 family predicted Fe2+/Mn2+ transporter